MHVSGWRGLPGPFGACVWVRGHAALRRQASVSAGSPSCLSPVAEVSASRRRSHVWVAKVECEGVF